MIIKASAAQIPLEGESVQCVVTSPPYWGLRKYEGTKELVWGGEVGCKHEWKENRRTGSGAQDLGSGKDFNGQGGSGHQYFHTSFCRRCGAWRGAFGLEPRIEMYVQHSVEILREVRRVLRKDGVCFWNIGDSYNAHPGQRTVHNKAGTKQQTVRGSCEAASRNDQNLKAKDLCLIPFRVALAAQSDGWWVRSIIIWAKNNPMPESVTDRPTTAHEYILMLTKSADYFWDAEAVKEKSSGTAHARGNGVNPKCTEPGTGTKQNSSFSGAVSGLVPTRNLRSVWEFAIQPYPEAHYATFPEELVRRCVAAGTSERGCCLECAAPWERTLESGLTAHDGKTKTLYESGTTANRLALLRQAERERGGEYTNSKKTGWRPTCACDAGEPVPCTVYDPFLGSGTTVSVARRMGRRAIGSDLAYSDLAIKRIGTLLLSMPATPDGVPQCERRESEGRGSLENRSGCPDLGGEQATLWE